MDIVYILGTGSRHDNIELRMSLRSICKYGTNIGRVIVAGDPVDWLSSKVEKVKIPRKYEKKHCEMMHRVQTVVENGIVDGEFLISSDDHFYVRPTDFDHYPVYFKCLNLRRSVVRKRKGYQYHKSLAQTRQLLEEYNLPVINFEQHCNTHLHAQVIKDFKWLIDKTYEMSNGCPPTTIVMNAWLSTDYAPKDIYKRTDLKIRKSETIQDIRKYIGASECFSIGDAVFSQRGIYDFFNSEFPDKCRYER